MLSVYLPGLFEELGQVGARIFEENMIRIMSNQEMTMHILRVMLGNVVCQGVQNANCPTCIANRLLHEEHTCILQTVTQELNTYMRCS